MAVQIYSPGNDNFEMNGDAVLIPKSCVAYAEINGMWYLELSHLLDLEGRWRFIEEEAVLKVKTWQSEAQLYRVQKVTKKDTVIEAEAYPIFFDARDDGFIITKHPTNKTAAEALQIMMEDLPDKYTSYVAGGISGAATAYFENRNLIDCLCGESPSFVERWGAELEYNNYEVRAYKNLGTDRGTEVRYARNITGITYEVDMSEIATRIYPQSYNGHRMYGETPWVDSPLINNYAKLYVKKITYENVRMSEDATGEEEEDVTICETQEELDEALEECCEADFAAGIDKPKVRMEVDIVSLADTVEYSNFRPMETIRLGDTVHVYHSKLGITSDSRAIAIEYDCLTQRTQKVTLGDFAYDYMREMSTAVSRIRGAIRPNGTVVAERVAGFLNGAYTSLRAQYNIAERQDVMAILFENLDQTSPLYGALGIGTQGLMISRERDSNDTDWIWTTAVTASGAVADIIVTGLLSDSQGRNYWDLDTGEFRLAADAMIGDQGIGEYVNEGFVENLLKDVPGFTTDYWTVYPNRDVLTYGMTDPYGGTKAVKLARVNGSETFLLAKAETNFPQNENLSDKTEYVFSVWIRATINATRPVKLFFNGQELSIYPTKSWKNYKLTAIVKRKSDGTASIGGQGSFTSDGGYDLYIYNPKVTYADFFDTQQGTFNLLTRNGALQGIFMQNGQLYINASMIQAGLLRGDLIDARNLVVRDGNNNVTLSVSSTGEVTMNVSSLSVSGVGISQVVSDAATTAAQQAQHTYTQQEIFNILTNNGAAQGIFMQNGELYINASMIQSGLLVGNLIDARGLIVRDGNNDVTLSISSTGEVTLNVSSLSISGTSISQVVSSAATTAAQQAQHTYTQQEIFNILTDNGNVQGIFLQNGSLYINGDFINVSDLRAIVAQIGGFAIGTDEIASAADQVTGIANLHLYKDGRMSFGGTYSACVAATSLTSRAYPYLDTNGYFHQLSVKDYINADCFVRIYGQDNTDSNNPWHGAGLYVVHRAYFATHITVKGSIYLDGTVINTSDERLKENIGDSPEVSEKLKKLRVRSFDWKETKEHVEAGLIAQEVQEVIPELVTDGGGYLGVSHLALVPYLLKAWQESEKKHERQLLCLKEENAALRRDMEALKEDVEKLCKIVKGGMVG